MKPQKILFITDDLPGLENNGSRMRTSMLCRLLSDHGEVHILTPDTKINRASALKFSGNVHDIIFFKADKIEHSLFSRVRNLLHATPWEVSDTSWSAVKDQIDALIKEHDFTKVFCRYFQMTIPILIDKKQMPIPVFVDVDDIDYKKKGMILGVKMLFNYTFLRKMLNLWFLKIYFRRLNKCSRLFVCSEADKAVLRKNRIRRPIEVLPNTVCDTPKDAPIYTKGAWKRNSISFIGDLGYTPNRDGIEFFIREVYPEIAKRSKGVRLNVIGRHPRRSLEKYIDNRSIFLYPNPETVDEFYRSTSLIVCPLRVGGGTRIKILEAMAYGLPVVSTSMGSYGLDVEHGNDLLCADDALRLSEQCVRVLTDYDLAEKIAKNGYNRFHSKYSVQKVREQAKGYFN